MSRPKLVRSGGFALLTGGALEAALWVLLPTLGSWSLNSGDPFLFQILILLGTMSSLLLAVGLVGLYARLSSSNGGWSRGLATMGLILAGVSAATVVISLAQVVTVGLISNPGDSFLATVVYPVGLWALPLAAGFLGLASLSDGEFGSWGFLPLLVCLLTLVGVPSIVLGLCWMLLGYTLVSVRRARPLKPGSAEFPEDPASRDIVAR